MTRESFNESMAFAVAALKSDKSKALLTTLSVLIGSASLVLVLTVASSGKRFILSRIEGIGANLAYATLDRNGEPPTLDDELTLDDMKAIRNAIPDVVAVAGTYDAPVDFEIAGKPRHARLVGATEDFSRIRNLRITAGRYFDFEDFRSLSRVCLVTNELLQSNRALQIGDQLKIDHFGCTVIGSFVEGVPTFGQSEIQADTVLVPFPLAQLVTGESFLQVIYAQASSSSAVKHVTAEVSRVLSGRHRRQARYSVENLSSLLATAGDVALAMTLVLLAVGLVTLIVGGTGIMNIMLSTIAERRHEIGLRKALGASSAEIRLQFLLEAVLISAAGAVTGIALAVAAVAVLALFAGDIVGISVSWESIVLALTVSSAVGIIFGYQPASRAAQLNPVEALRSEA